jgi:hypothetical protein
MSDLTGASTPESEPGSVPEPAAPAAAPVLDVAPTVAPVAAPAALPIPAWSSLDQDTQMVAGGGLGAAVVLLIVGIIGAWPSTEFLLIALLAAVVAGAAAWFHVMLEDQPANVRSVPGPIVGLFAGSVLAVLAVGNVIETLFELDDLDALGALAAIALAIAAGALLVGAVRRAPEIGVAIRSTATTSRLALAGIGLVLVGWALNLASYWNMSAATVVLTVLTLAALVILLTGRGLPALSAWAGVALGAVGAVITLDHWNGLLRIGRTQLTLGITDFLPILLISVGVALIIVAGVLLGLAARPVATPPTPTPQPGGQAG